MNKRITINLKPLFMRINEKKLKNLIVETKSGQVLGYVIDFELETETGIIVKYNVKSKNPIAGLFQDRLIIDKEQIIEFTDKKIIVEDNVIKALAKEEAKQDLKNIEGVEPAITSKIGN